MCFPFVKISSTGFTPMVGFYVFIDALGLVDLSLVGGEFT